MKIVGLVRCSTEDQNDTSLPVQRHAIEVFARANRHQIVDWIEQPGQSGFCHTTNDVRKKLPKLYSLVTNPPFDFEALVFFDQSRFGRMPAKTMFWLEETASQFGIRFISLQNPDLKDDDVGGDVIKVVSQHAAYEHSKVLREKSVAGAQQACEQGWRVGGAAPAGYNRVVHRNGELALLPDGSPWILRRGERKPNSREYKVKLAVDEVWAPIIRDIFDWHSSGDGYGAIARRLNGKGLRRPTGRLWTKEHIYGILHDPSYAGHVVYGRNKPRGGHYEQTAWTICERAHEPLCTADQWAYVQARTSDYRPMKSARRKSDRFILNGGLMRCVHCGANMVGWVRGTGCRPAYICGGYKSNSTECTHGNLIDAQRLEDTVLDKIRVLLEDERLVAQVERTLTTRTKTEAVVASELAETKRQISNMIDAIARLGADGDLQGKLQALRAQKAALEERLRSEAASTAGPKELVRKYREMREGLLSSDREVQREIVKKLVDGPMVVDQDRNAVDVRLKLQGE